MSRRALLPGSAASRLDAYFAANPDEELTMGDATAKFGVAPLTIYKAIERLSALNRIEYAKVIRRPAKGRA